MSRDWKKDMELIKIGETSDIPYCISEFKNMLPYYHQQYASGERHNVKLCKQILETELREKKLREAIQTAIEMKELNPEQMATDQKGAYDAAMWFLSGVMDSLYPKEETKP